MPLSKFWTVVFLKEKALAHRITWMTLLSLLPSVNQRQRASAQYREEYPMRYRHER